LYRYEQTRLPEESQIYLSQASSLLERYVYLIVFNAYLSEQAPLHFAVAFSVWLAGREEINSILAQIKADPNKALRITGHLLAPQGKAKQWKGDSFEEEEELLDEATRRATTSLGADNYLDNSGDDVVRSRKGDVLSKNMMIKADLYQYNRAKYGENAKLVAVSQVSCSALRHCSRNDGRPLLTCCCGRTCATSVRRKAMIASMAWDNQAWRARARSSPTSSIWNVPRTRTSLRVQQTLRRL
jgi:hypothetical protein